MAISARTKEFLVAALADRTAAEELIAAIEKALETAEAALEAATEPPTP